MTMRFLALIVAVGFSMTGLVFGANGILDYTRFMRDIEPLLLTTTYSSPGPTPMTCVSCHGDTLNPAYAAFPLIVGQSRANFVEAGRRITLDEPDTSTLLLAPLAQAAGGTVVHGTAESGGEQFPTTNDTNYQTILDWIVDAKRASIGARITKTEPHPNPFRRETNLVYYLTTAANKVDVTVYTSSGHQLRRFQGDTLVGANTVLWDGRDEDGDPLPTGIYFYSVKATFDDGTVVRNGRCVHTP